MKKYLVCSLFWVTTPALAQSTVATATQPNPNPAIDLQPQLEVFASGRAFQNEVKAPDRFELGRTEMGFSFLAPAYLTGEVLAEAVRSSDGGVAGVVGDSMIFRVKRAWVGTSRQFGLVVVGAKAGMVADPWISHIDAVGQLRAISPSVQERIGSGFSSDAGIVASVSAGGVIATVALLNGEGANQPERNDGKNVHAQISWEAFSVPLHDQPHRLTVSLAAREGSLGVAQARDHRLLAGLAFHGRYIAAGAEAVCARGVAGNPQLEMFAIAGWIRAMIPDYSFGVFAHASHQHQSQPITSDATFMQGGFFWQMANLRAGHLSAFAGVATGRADNNAAMPSTDLSSGGISPGAFGDNWEGFLTLQWAFGTHSEGP